MMIIHMMEDLELLEFNQGGVMMIIMIS